MIVVYLTITKLLIFWRFVVIFTMKQGTTQNI